MTDSSVTQITHSLGEVKLSGASTMDCSEDSKSNVEEKKERNWLLDSYRVTDKARAYVKKWGYSGGIKYCGDSVAETYRGQFLSAFDQQFPSNPLQQFADTSASIHEHFLILPRDAEEKGYTVDTKEPQYMQTMKMLRDMADNTQAFIDKYISEDFIVRLPRYTTTDTGRHMLKFFEDWIPRATPRQHGIRLIDDQCGTMEQAVQFLIQLGDKEPGTSADDLRESLLSIWCTRKQWGITDDDTEWNASQQIMEEIAKQIDLWMAAALRDKWIVEVPKCVPNV